METESSSPECLEELRRFTLVCLEGYAKGAVAKMLEAEELIAKGMDLRDEAKAMFARANELALEYAKAKASYVAPPVPEEDIPW